MLSLASALRVSAVLILLGLGAFVWSDARSQETQRVLAPDGPGNADCNNALRRVTREP